MNAAKQALFNQPEVVNAFHKITDIDGSDISCHYPGWVMDEKHFLSFSDTAVTVHSYIRNGYSIEIPEDSQLVAWMDIQFINSPEHKFDLRELSKMTFKDFIYRLIASKEGSV